MRESALSSGHLARVGWLNQMGMIMHKVLFGTFAAVSIFAASLVAPAPSIAQARIKTVATFSILADLVKNVGGSRIEVSSLVGPNGDVHVFEPSPADARKLADAQVVFVNGLGLEGWMTRLVEASGAKSPMIVASRGVKTYELEEDGKSKTDPHAWQAIANAKIYVANIRDALAAADLAGKAAYEANASAYLTKLDGLDAEIRAAIAKIAPDRRRIITSHDAFGYFGTAYGMQFIAPQGVSTESDISAKDVARIITQIKNEKIPGVFLENVAGPRLMDQIAKESGARIGGKIYSDALSDESGPASTYIDMMRNKYPAIHRCFGQVVGRPMKSSERFTSCPRGDHLVASA